jgi:acyl-coenzyme A synthetase/AMP-(fatty) acid ligase
MPLNTTTSLKNHLNQSGDSSRRFLWGATAQACLGELLRGTSLGGHREVLSGRSVLIATREQLATALALVELDGLARRVIICPPDIPLAQFPAVLLQGDVDAIVSDYELPDHVCPGGTFQVVCGSILPAKAEQREPQPTEWVLLTSGTTGAPKMIVHTLESLTAPIRRGPEVRGDNRTNDGREDDVVWGTFYDIRRYGGLQIFLRAILGKGSLLLSSPSESVADHLRRLGDHGVTHLSGTPSHWRRALMSPQARAIAPGYIRLSGEIADQPILNALRSFYPNSAISQAFASTEAGVAFEVHDGFAGFPASLLGKSGEVEMRVINDSLQIRSNRNASHYLNRDNGPLTNEDAFVDTGDIVERRGNRYHFLGRRNGVINVGGLKVYPEEIEQVIGRHPAVRMSLVQARRSPITGSIVSADVVLKDEALNDMPSDDARIGYLRNEILQYCRDCLPPHKVPASIRCVSELRLAAAGKVIRQHA